MPEWWPYQPSRTSGGARIAVHQAAYGRFHGRKPVRLCRNRPLGKGASALPVRDDRWSEAGGSVVYDPRVRTRKTALAAPSAPAPSLPVPSTLYGK